MESGVTIGESVVSPSGANALDLLVQSFIAIPKDVAAANQLNTDSFCGYTGWTANTPRSVAGAHCGGTTVPNLPSLNSTWYSVVRIDFSRNPEALYIGASTSSNDGSTPDKRHPKYSAAAFKN